MADVTSLTVPKVAPKGRDIGFAIGIIIILSVLFLPIPPFLIDLGLAFSISFSVLILMVALWIQKPLDFSSFPTILLIATMTRLSLNIATTRVILSHGNEGHEAAGHVIAGFAGLVMSGDFVIGLIVFLILVVVNFIVITKGATRIAEVGARFTLDAIPGKQMSIDADLSAGMIDEVEARRRRKELEDESSFFGAMDGASKFVRGDAVAGLLIGLLTIKPQLGILFPVMLVAGGRWRVIVSATLTALALVAASVAIGGVQAWSDYLAKGLPTMTEVLRDPSGIAVPFHASVFMNLRGPFGDRLAEAIQMSAALAAAAGAFAVFRYRPDAEPAKIRAFFVACTMSVSPYMGIYDVLPLTCAAVALVASGALDETGRRLAKLVFWLPALQLLFGNIQMPGPGLIAPAFAVYLGWQLFARVGDTVQLAEASVAAG